MRQPSFPLLLGLGLSLIATPTFPEAPASGSSAAQSSDAKARADIAFARGLATRYQYVDLAEAVLRDIEKAGTSRDMKEELGVVKCGIYAEGAKREGDPLLREELYAKAIDAYLEFIEGNQHSDFRPQAEREYVDIVNAYGRVLEMALEEALGEDAATLRTKLSTILEQALNKTGNLITELRAEYEATPNFQLKTELGRLMFNRGQMLFTLAKTADEGAYYFGQAEGDLEELALFLGETTPGGLSAYLVLAQVKAAQGLYEDAAAFSEFVIDTVTPSTKEAREDAGWTELPKEQLTARWRIAEKGVGTVCDSYLSLGDTESAGRWALHYYNTWKRDGFDLSRPWGYLGLLACARTLLDCGGHVGGALAGGELAWFATEEEVSQAGITGRRNRRSGLDMALLIAQTVNQSNKGNTLQVRAQKLISDVIGRPGVSVSPDVLFEAAQGEYYAKSYPAALDAFKRVLNSLDTRDDATRQEYKASVLFHIGDSLRRMERPLEGAMAHREAVTTWVTTDEDEYTSKNADGYYKAISDVRRGAPSDKVVEGLWHEAENLVTRYAENKGAIVWRQAERLYSAKDFSAAREKYLEIEPSADTFEKGISKAALCLYKQDDQVGAKAEFLKYLNGFVQDPKNAVNTLNRIAVRKEARATAVYYVGVIDYKSANRTGSGYESVVERLTSYPDDFPDQDSYGPRALHMVLMSNLALKNYEAAKANEARLIELFPKDKSTASGATKIYTVLAREQSIAEAAGDTAKSDALKRQMAEYMGISNELASEPSFGNMRTESRLWMQLGEWKEGERVLQIALANFQGDAKFAKDIVRYVKPDLGECLLRQHDVNGAFTVLDPLVPDPDDKSDTRKPSPAVVANWADSICGWIEGEGRTITEVPGVGGAENLQKASRRWVQLTNAEARDAKWECRWYELKFSTAYCYYQWGKEDSAKTAAAKSQIDTLRTELGQELQGVEDSCGNETQRLRFLWLWNKVQ